MARALCLGIDVGTSGVRSAVIDEGGIEVASARVAFARPAGTEADARGWWSAVEACLEAQCASLAAAHFDAADIAAVAVDGTSGSMVLVDEALEPVTPALMYNSAGFEAEAARIAPHAEPGSITRGPGSGLARLLRLQSLDRAGQARHLCHQADFIMARLIGRAGLSDDNNTLKTGFDPAVGRWPDWLAATGLRTALLPDVLRVGAPAGTVTPALQRRFGFSDRLIVRAGTTDSIAAFLASGAQEIGDAVTSLGTTLAIKLLSAVRIDDAARGLYSHRLGTRWLVGGASNSGGGALLQHFTAAQIEALSGQIDPAMDSGLDYYPLTTPGERFPVNDPHLAPRLAPRPPDDALFLKGMLEGIARIEAEGYRALAALGAPEPRRIHTTGGGASNPIWTAIRRRIVSPLISAAPSADAAYGMAQLCRQHAAKEDRG
ncbi:MAG: FGGY-family carbohydrate kinase [Beijerinckiaceae bacterium]|nr:FGGY-family carbohydrate kinase [Beijerinckiaceae bacterium]